MKNIERYNALHNEIMKRLNNGEITTEQAKDKNIHQDMKEIYDELVETIKPVIRESKFKRYIKINKYKEQKTDNETYGVIILSYSFDKKITPVSDKLYNEWYNDNTITECTKLLKKVIEKYQDKYTIGESIGRNRGFISLETK